jgi:hypothetical protein
MELWHFDSSWWTLAMNAFLTISFFGSGLIALALYFLRQVRLQKKAIIYCSTASIIRLFRPPNATPHDLLIARATPNQRLVRAFALTNTFVSSDPNIHASFVGHTKHLLRTAEKRGWSIFQQISVEAVHAALPLTLSLDFDTFVQDVTLRVALVGLLEVDADVAELDPDDIQVVAALITELWALSKKPDPIPIHILPRLNDHLRHLVPDKDMYPNPLDYVIPVWETLWRVVATTIAHVHHDRISCDTLGELHSSPTLRQFRLFKDEFQPSAEALISETMRLHPPSKHIIRAAFLNTFSSMLPFRFRHFLPKSFGYVLRECADIGTVLRESGVWGPDAAQFKPVRHHSSNIAQDQLDAMAFVFGYGRHRCVAASWAPMAAAIIVAAILDQVQDESGYKLKAGPRIGGREGWEGWSVICLV